MLSWARWVRALVLGGLCGSLLAAAVPGAAAAQPLHALLPLARGQLLVSLGPPPQWLPESGVATDLTLFSGRAAAGRARANAYVALQTVSRGCGRTPTRDHAHPLVFAGYYASRDLIAHQPGSPYAGAQAGDYAAAASGVVVRQAGATRVCAWLGAKPRTARLALSQRVPLLNGLFAASVSAFPAAAGTAVGQFTLDAIDIGRTFSYAATTDRCGASYRDAGGSVSDGELATESIALSANPCSGDQSVFTFAAAGHTLGTVAYTVAQASAGQIATVGGCELDPLVGVALNLAEPYVGAVGCAVGRVLVAPYSSSLPRGDVVEAQVDGGLAEVAPLHTAVDLVVNGAP